MKHTISFEHLATGHENAMDTVHAKNKIQATLTKKVYLEVSIMHLTTMKMMF